MRVVYIYKKIVGGRSYYYLRASERRGKRGVTKDVAYLGSSIEDVKKALGSLGRYKSRIRKAYKTIHKFLESNHYLEEATLLKLKRDDFLGERLAGVEACRLHYNKAFKRLDAATRGEILKNFVIEFAFNTASIEGNTINLKEARNLLEDGRTPKNRTLREVYDLQNTERVFMGLLEADEDISHDLITKTHSELMKSIDARTGYRIDDVRVIKSNFEATPAPYVKTDMDLLLKWYEGQKGRLHPMVLATIFHHKFEKIHPFMDGNGRTGRMLLNLILVKNGYPPLIIHRRSRLEYLDALGKADKSGPNAIRREDYSQLVDFVADEMVNYYWDIFL